MARNKYPEETVQKILETAARLFMQKGYDQTSIQDIIDQLGGLSKGAIYHHFRSKEDILNSVMEHIYGDNAEKLRRAFAIPGLTGQEKLRRLLECSVMDSAQAQAFAMGLDMLQNPRILVAQLRASVEEVARCWIQPLVEEGIADGSLAGVQFPRQFAETISLLSNIWMNPMVFPVTPQEMEQNCLYYRHLLECQGVDGSIISDALIARLREYTAIFQNRTQARN